MARQFDSAWLAVMMRTYRLCLSQLEIYTERLSMDTKHEVENMHDIDIISFEFLSSEARYIGLSNTVNTLFKKSP